MSTYGADTYVRRRSLVVRRFYTGMDGSCGRICIGRRRINLSHVFAGQRVGVREVSENIWLVSFMHYDLGFFDHESGASHAAKLAKAVRVLPSKMRTGLTQH